MLASQYCRGSYITFVDAACFNCIGREREREREEENASCVCYCTCSLRWYRFLHTQAHSFKAHDVNINLSWHLSCHFNCWIEWQREKKIEPEHCYNWHWSSAIWIVIAKTGWERERERREYLHKFKRTVSDEKSLLVGWSQARQKVDQFGLSIDIFIDELFIDHFVHHRVNRLHGTLTSHEAADRAKEREKERERKSTVTWMTMLAQ